MNKRMAIPSCIVAAVLGVSLVGVGIDAARPAASRAAPPARAGGGTSLSGGIHTIKHVIVIMQENR